MRKLLAVLFALLLLVSLSACGKGGNEEEKGKGFNPDTMKTMGDVLSVDIDGSGWEMGEDYMVIVQYGDNFLHRYSAHLSSDIYERLDAIDFFDEQRNEKYVEILKEVPVEKYEDLSDKLPDEEKLNSFVGKTGQELLDMGATSSGYMLDGDNAQFFLDIGLFEYLFTFNEHVEYSEDLDEEEVLKTLTVKSVEYQSVAQNATDLNITE